MAKSQIPAACMHQLYFDLSQIFHVARKPYNEICTNKTMELLHAAGICVLTINSYVKFREKHDGALVDFFKIYSQAKKKLLKLRP